MIKFKNLILALFVCIFLFISTAHAGLLMGERSNLKTIDTSSFVSGPSNITMSGAKVETDKANVALDIAYFGIKSIPGGLAKTTIPGSNLMMGLSAAADVLGIIGNLKEASKKYMGATIKFYKIVPRLGFVGNERLEEMILEDSDRDLLSHCGWKLLARNEQLLQYKDWKTDETNVRTAQLDVLLKYSKSDAELPENDKCSQKSAESLLNHIMSLISEHAIMLSNCSSVDRIMGRGIKNRASNQ